jgi:hypothetical protein
VFGIETNTTSQLFEDICKEKERRREKKKVMKTPSSGKYKNIMSTRLESY